MRSQGGLTGGDSVGPRNDMDSFGRGQSSQGSLLSSDKVYCVSDFKLVKSHGLSGVNLTCRQGLSDCQAHEKCRQGRPHLDGDHSGLLVRRRILKFF